MSQKLITPAPSFMDVSKLFHKRFSELSYRSNDIVITKLEVNWTKIWKLITLTALAVAAATLLITAVNAQMMGGWGGSTGYPSVPTTLMPVTPYQAVAYAQQYLSTYYPGTTTGNMTTFYGYYAIKVLSAGKTYGVLSINGYTGQVWFHNWHGTFVQEMAL